MHAEQMATCEKAEGKLVCQWMIHDSGCQLKVIAFSGLAITAKHTGRKKLTGVWTPRISILIGRSIWQQLHICRFYLKNVLIKFFALMGVEENWPFLFYSLAWKNLTKLIWLLLCMFRALIWHANVHNCTMILYQFINMYMHTIKHL